MFECLKRDDSKPTNDIGSHGEGESFKPKWGYIVPHTKKAGGAETPDNKWSEYQYGKVVAITNGAFIPWDDRNHGGVKEASKRLVAHGCNSLFEDHKNAYRGFTRGAEILVIRGDELSIKYAEFILEEFKKQFPDHPIRGIKQMKKGGRGYNNLRDMKRGGADVALLGEMFFIDNVKDWIDQDTYAKFLVRVMGNV